MASGWERTVDVLVLGSGAGGLTAAVRARDAGADVAVVEKAASIGGTSALSMGVVWVPANHLLAASGASDSRAEALAYLDSLSLGCMDWPCVGALVETAPRMLRYLERHTPMRFAVACDCPDYHPERRGGRPDGGRSLDVRPFPFGTLGQWAARVRAGPGPPLTASELRLAQSSQGPDRAILRDRRAKGLRGLGQALVGALLRACLDRGVPILTSVRAVQLLGERGEVQGVRAARAGREVRLRARRAVILATGGFEWSDELVRAYLGGPLIGAIAPPECEGDGLRMAMAWGAQLGNMSEAWWCPALAVDGERVRGRRAHRMCVVERAHPHAVLVNASGRRFTNEAACYNETGRSLRAFDPGSFAFPNVPAWLIFDRRHRFVRELTCTADAAPADLGRGSTPRELAGEIGVDPLGLAEALDRFNHFAEKGRDPDFGRGGSAYDRSIGDPTRPGSHATLGTIEAAPFHARAVLPGSIGTKGGPRTNARAQVLDTYGNVVRGLYAAGNVMASPLGMAYPGAGATLASAMTFGFLAGLHAAGEKRG